MNDLQTIAKKANQLYQSGQYEDARSPLKAILDLQPNNDSAMHMLAFAEHKCGDDATAFDLLQKALSVNPKNFNCHELMGYLYAQTDDHDKAEECYLTALKFNPNHANLHKNLGMLFLKRGNYDRAIVAFGKAVLKAPNNLHHKQLFTGISADFTLPDFNRDIKNVVTLCLQEDRIIHKYLENNWINMVHNDPDFLPLRQIDPDQSVESFADGVDLKALAPVLTDPYFLLGIRRFYLTSMEYEKKLALLRYFLLDKVAQNDFEGLHDLMPFFISLAFQCWLNEYVYSETDEEKKHISALEETLQSNGDNTNDNLLRICILGCYRPLYKTSIAQQITEKLKSVDNPVFQELIKIQIEEPLEEEEIKKTIPVHGNIDNKTSKEVQGQYEENPYPRWKTVHVNNEIGHTNNKKIDILVAGCGTGQEPASLLQMYPGQEIFCVDLSLSSLAYAIRQTRALKLDDRLTFMQADILELGTLDKKFDVIYSSGVLHHMKDPEVGLKVLKSLLKPEGEMFISLYSEVARPHVVAARNYIEEHKIGSSAQDIRYMRQIIADSPDEALKNCMKAGDFYTLSQVRDLIFHVQEHRFTIPKIRDMLERHGLDFIEFFCFTQKDRQKFLEHFPEDGAIRDLSKWEIFEQEKPEFFMNKMYGFRVRLSSKN